MTFKQPGQPTPGLQKGGWTVRNAKWALGTCFKRSCTTAWTHQGCLFLYMPQLLLYATPYFAHILHHTRDTTGFWIQSWLLLLQFASLRPAWRKTPEVTEKQSDAKWWLGWEVLQKSRQREYQINSQGQDVRTNSSKDFTTQKWKWKSQQLQFTPFEFAAKPVWGHFFVCVMWMCYFNPVESQYK